ncbi:MAG: hypothetical protein ACM3WV_03940, partial [Bacillota bacterium]
MKSRKFILRTKALGLGLILLAGLLLVCSAWGSAAVNIFTDGFESGNFTAGGWTNSGCAVQSTYKRTGTYAAVFNSSDTLTKALSTAGYTNIVVEYARYTRSCETDDHFIAEWYNGSVWSTLEDLTGSSTWTLQTWTLPAGADNNPNFQIRFKTVHNGSYDYAYLDDVAVRGDTANPTPTPTASGGAGTLGYAEEGNSTDYPAPNNIIACKAVASSGFTATHMKIKFNAAGTGSFKCGIYADNAGT